MARVERIHSFEDDMNGIARYRLGEKMVAFDARQVAECGLAKMLEYVGFDAPDTRVPVYYSGERIGTVPWDFDPEFVKSKSFLYEARRGDFVPHKDGWLASNSLGPGDLELVVGLVLGDAA